MITRQNMYYSILNEEQTIIKKDEHLLHFHLFL